MTTKEYAAALSLSLESDDNPITYSGIELPPPPPPAPPSFSPLPSAMTLEDVLHSIHHFSKGPKESRIAILATNAFLFVSLVTCVASMASFVILKQKKQMAVLKTLTIFREIAVLHQSVLFCLAIVQLLQLFYLLCPASPPQVFILQDLLFALCAHYLTTLSSMAVVLILFYSVNLVYEIPKLLEIGRLVLKREHICRLVMIPYGIWFSSLNKLDTVTTRVTIFTSITFTFNPFDGLLIITSSFFVCRHMLEIYRKQYQRLFGNRLFLLISILLLVKLASLFLNLTAILAIKARVDSDDGNDSFEPTFFEVLRMTEGLALGAVYVILKAIWIVIRK